MAIVTQSGLFRVIDIIFETIQGGPILQYFVVIFDQVFQVNAGRNCHMRSLSQEVEKNLGNMNLCIF